MVLLSFRGWGFYYRKDHLGNIREVWNGVRKNYSKQVKELASTRQRTQYYPSGLPWAESFGAAVQKHKYNDKEFIEMHGLDEYDSEARWFYPAIMRTTTIDPLAEKYYSISPYAWCGGNPVQFIDPTGEYILVHFENKEAYELFKKVINAALEGQFEVSFGKTIKGNDNKAPDGYAFMGIKATENGGNLSEMTENGQNFFKSMNEMASDKKTTAQIKIVYGKENVDIGNFDLNKIDIADVSQFEVSNKNSNEGATQGGKLIHETRELFEKTRGRGYQNSHSRAVIDEDFVNGSKRGKDKYNPMNNTTQTIYTEKNNRKTIVKYVDNTKIIKRTTVRL